MKLGNIWNISLKSSDETSMIISKFCHPREPQVPTYDSICIENWIDVWQGKGDKSKYGSNEYFGNRSFKISLYVCKHPNTDIIRTLGLTFTKIKRNYTNKEYHVEDDNTSIIIKEIYQGIVSNLHLLVNEETDYEFGTSYIMKAQSWVEKSYGYGASTNYYIVGIKIRRWF